MRGIKRVVFDNGLVLMTEKRAYTKEVVILVATKSGSMNEPSGDAGITHFVEHMLFRSNKWRTNREIAEELESAGAEINAFTDHDFMAFYAKTLSNEIPKTLKIIFEAAVNDEYDKDEFLREKDDILSEIKIGIEHPIGYLYSNLFKPTLFRGTPLEKTVDGTVKTVSKITLPKLIEHKKKIFVPKKPMVVVVVGRFNEEELVEQVGNTFGTLPNGHKKNGLKMKPKNEKSRKFEEREEIEQAYLAMGYQVPGHPHRDMFKLHLLQAILTSGMSSRLFRELRDKRGVGYLAASELESLDGIGCLCFDVSIYDPNRIEEVEEVIRTELQDLKMNLVSAKELEKAKNLIIRQYYDDLDQIESRAFHLMVQEFQNIPYDFRKFEYYIRMLSAKSIRKTAQQYFNDDYTLTALVPKGTKIS